MLLVCGLTDGKLSSIEHAMVRVAAASAVGAFPADQKTRKARCGNTDVLGSAGPGELQGAEVHHLADRATDNFVSYNAEQPRFGGAQTYEAAFESAIE